jgi:FkbM family methyltransferase
VRCENIAISDHKGSAPFWHLRKNTLLPPGYDQIGSFSRDHLLKHADVFPGMEAFITCRQIPCTTIRDLLKKHDMQRVELVFIDTEGYDFEIVKQLDLKDQAPELLIYEEMHLSEADRIACRELLHAAGYSILTAGGDSVAVKVPRPTDEVLKVRS